MVPDTGALERAEFAAMIDVYRAASAAVVDRAGLVVEAVGPVHITAATRVDVLALNRALGLALDRPVHARDVDRVVTRIAALGAPCVFVPIAPAPHAADAARLLEARGLRHYNNWMRLHREIDDLPARTSDLEIVRATPAEGPLFSEIVASAFQYPPEVAPMPGDAVGRAGWRHYIARAGGTPIAAAAMYLDGPTAWFGFAGTLASHRGRGAQKALIAHRLREARDAGCRWVSIETAEPTAQRDAPSFRNLVAFGFTSAYVRPNYLWTRA